MRLQVVFFICPHCLKKFATTYGVQLNCLQCTYGGGIDCSPGIYGQHIHTPWATSGRTICATRADTHFQHGIQCSRVRRSSIKLGLRRPPRAAIEPLALLGFITFVSTESHRRATNTPSFVSRASLSEKVQKPQWYKQLLQRLLLRSRSRPMTLSSDPNYSILDMDEMYDITIGRFLRMAKLVGSPLMTGMKNEGCQSTPLDTLTISQIYHEICYLNIDQNNAHGAMDTVICGKTIELVGSQLIGRWVARSPRFSAVKSIDASPLKIRSAESVVINPSANRIPTATKTKFKNDIFSNPTRQCPSQTQYKIVFKSCFV